MEIIDGHSGNNHVSARDIADINTAVFGAGDYILDVGNKFAYEIVTNNEIQIKDGIGICQGVRFLTPNNESDKVFIDNGTQAKFRNDLIVAKYKKDGTSAVESFELKVIKGTPADSAGAAKDPAVVTGNLRENEIEHDVKLYRVRLEGLNIAGIDTLFKIKKFPNITSGLKEQGYPEDARTGDIHILY